MIHCSCLFILLILGVSLAVTAIISLILNYLDKRREKIKKKKVVYTQTYNR